MKEVRELRINRLKARAAALQEQIKALEEDPDIRNREFKVDMLKGQLSRVTEKIKELSQKDKGKVNDE